MDQGLCARTDRCFTPLAAAMTRTTSRASSRAESLQLVAEAEEAADRELDHLMAGLSDWSRAEKYGMLGC